MALAPVACTSRDKVAAAAATEAETAFQQGRNQDAERAIRRALASRDDVSEYWLLLGRIATARKDLSGAFTAYENAIELDRGNVEALRLLCQLGLNVNQPDKVDKYADQLLLLTPADPLPRVMKGGAALQRGDSAAALLIAEEVLAKRPDDLGARILKGRVLAWRGDYAGAASFIDGPVTVGKDDASRLTFLKELYTQANDRPHYQDTVKRLAQAKPDDPDCQLDYADMLYQIGQSDAANAVIVRQTQRRPNDIGLASKILDVWLKQGPDALTQAQIMRQAAGASLEMKSAYGQFANETGHPEIAIALLADALAGAKPSVAASDALATLAYAIGLQGHRTDAIGRLNEILALDPTHPRALLARARLRAAGKDLTGAISDARHIVADDANNVTARLTLFDLLIEHGDQDLAESALREGVRASPGDPRLTLRLYNMLASRGDRDGARDALTALTRAAPVSLRATRLRATIDPAGKIR